MTSNLPPLQNCNHTIHRHDQHLAWDNAQPPAIMIAPGDVVEFADLDATCGQITPDTNAADLANLDFGRVNPISGPVYIDGAEPGDAIKVELLGFQSSGWAWSAIIPGFGLLDEDFGSSAINIWNYAKDFETPALYGAEARIPLKPFCGTIGLASAQPGPHSTIPPYATGGNMDTRDLSLGVELYLPVQVAGGLFSIGDPHAAQGDGEVCGTAIESPMSVTARLDLVKGANLKFPRFRTHGPVTRHHDIAGYDATMGIGPDLMAAAQNAVRGMIELLCREHKMAADRAYILCSVAGDLRISEIVDQPNWVISFYMPRQIFE